MNDILNDYVNHCTTNPPRLTEAMLCQIKRARDLRLQIILLSLASLIWTLIQTASGLWLTLNRHPAGPIILLTTILAMTGSTFFAAALLNNRNIKTKPERKHTP